MLLLHNRCHSLAEGWPSVGECSALDRRHNLMQGTVLDAKLIAEIGDRETVLRSSESRPPADSRLAAAHTDHRCECVVACCAVDHAAGLSRPLNYRRGASPLCPRSC